MYLTLAEKFILLAHHPEKSTYVIPDPMRNVGLIGSILFDLASDNKIKIHDDGLMVKNTSTDLPAVHKKILLEMANSQKKRKVKAWIARFAQRSGRYRKEVLELLERKRILNLERKRFLFIPYIKATMIKPNTRQEIVTDLHGILHHLKDADSDQKMLLSIIHACKLHKVICRDREEMKEVRAKLKVFVQSDLIAQGVDRVIHEMQAAMIGVLAASSAAASVATR